MHRKRFVLRSWLTPLWRWTRPGVSQPTGAPREPVVHIPTPRQEKPVSQFKGRQAEGMSSYLGESRALRSVQTFK